jgi:hypothetical protein
MKAWFLHCLRKAAFLLGAAVLAGTPAFAGVDSYGTVNKIQVASDGTLLFSIVPVAGTPDPTLYCKPGWGGLNMYVPASNAQYAYYYGLLLNSFNKGFAVLVANISVFNGSTACDVTQTGYGVLLLK